MKKRNKDFLGFVIALAFIILFNLISHYKHIRLDLTADKRYTLSETTESLLDNIDDFVFFRVYLEGDFPASFSQLRDETQRMLNEFRSRNPKIEYEFINPSADPDQENRYAIYRQLQEQGLNPTTLQVSEGDDRSEKVIFPGAIVSYRGKEMAVSLLSSGNGANSDQILGSAVQMLEFQLANAIQRLMRFIPPKIGFLSGHGELDELSVEDISNKLKESYFVDRLDLRQFEIDTITGVPSLKKQQEKLEEYELLIIAKPQDAFTDLDLFLIDQFVMNGGKTLWLIDAVHAEMDSLARNQKIITFPNRALNIDQLLFRYGARVNYNLIQDLNASPILVPEAQIGAQAQWGLRSWPYFPMVRPNNSEHPIVKNLAPLKTEFISSVDTIIVKGIKKEFIMFSSPYSRLISTPNTITLDLLNQQVNPEEYTKKVVPVALVLEGEFDSYYKNGMPRNQGQQLSFKQKGSSTKMIVIGDGDIIKNQIHRGEAYPLGIDKWTYERTGLVYGNKSFIENCVDYLLDDNGLMEVRSKQLQIRLLNKAEVLDKKVQLQLINILLPLGIISLLAGFMFYFRKKKYTRKAI